LFPYTIRPPAGNRTEHRNESLVSQSSALRVVPTGLGSNVSRTYPALKVLGYFRGSRWDWVLGGSSSIL
jgi:hypothetical protein